MKKIVFCTLFIVLFVSLSNGQTTGGQLLTLQIDSPSLSNNKIDYSPTREINVYLPPSYSSSQKNYPVVYFLAGHGDRSIYFLNGLIQGFRLQNSMDNLISSGAIKEMIFVLLDGINLMDGSFYENSPASGNWSDWVAKDVVTYIDNNYRTIKKREARAIAGHSMGGFGAINVGMKNSDTFGIIYSMSPGLYDQNGLKDQGTFTSETIIKSYLSKIDEWSKMDKTNATNAFRAYMTSRINAGDWFTCFIYGYGAAFSPDTTAYPHYTKYPYSYENGVLKCDSTVLQNYENGYGGFKDKIKKYKTNLQSLVDFTIEYGTKDEYSWICRGSDYTSELLKAAGIQHQLISFNGAHGNYLRNRIEQHLLPHVSSKLYFEDGSTSADSRQGILNNYRLYQNYPNPFNPSTTIGYSVPKGGNVSLKIYNCSGELIYSLNEFKPTGYHKTIFNAADLASGVFYYQITCGNYSETKKMIYLK